MAPCKSVPAHGNGTMWGVFLRMLKRADFTVGSGGVYIFIAACCHDITIIMVKEQRGINVCPEESGDKVAMDGQGGPCWEMVVEWLLLRLQSRGRWQEASGCISQNLQAP